MREPIVRYGAGGGDLHMKAVNDNITTTDDASLAACGRSRS